MERERRQWQSSLHVVWNKRGFRKQGDLCESRGKVEKALALNFYRFFPFSASLVRSLIAGAVSYLGKGERNGCKRTAAARTLVIVETDSSGEFCIIAVSSVYCCMCVSVASLLSPQ